MCDVSSKMCDVSSKLEETSAMQLAEAFVKRIISVRLYSQARQVHDLVMSLFTRRQQSQRGQIHCWQGEAPGA